MVLKRVHFIGQHAVARGSYGDVWKGMLQGRAIAVKMLHVYGASNLAQLLKVILLYSH